MWYACGIRIANDNRGRGGGGGGMCAHSRSAHGPTRERTWPRLTHPSGQGAAQERPRRPRQGGPRQGGPRQGRRGPCDCILPPGPAPPLAQGITSITHHTQQHCRISPSPTHQYDKPLPPPPQKGGRIKAEKREELLCAPLRPSTPRDRHSPSTFRLFDPLARRTAAAQHMQEIPLRIPPHRSGLGTHTARINQSRVARLRAGRWDTVIDPRDAGRAVHAERSASAQRRGWDSDRRDARPRCTAACLCLTPSRHVLTNR